MALIGDYPGGLVDLNVDRTITGALVALRAGVFIAVDFKDADKAERAQKRSVRAQVTTPEITHQN
jgi:hypothetical protein